MNIGNLGVKKKMANKPISHFSKTHYSIIPVFHYSNCERSELSSVDDGDVAQLGERYVRNVQVGGSNPLISTITIHKYYNSVLPLHF